MKILGGQWKGRNFYMPTGIRPTQGLLRGAIFDLLGQDVVGLSFLELYAGSGAIGLEAASRGASEVVMVEKDQKNAAVIRENCDLLKVDLGGKVKVIEGDALATVKQLAARKLKFDIVFYDPPFGRRLGKKTLKVIYDNDILHAQSFVVAQCDTTERLEVPQGLSVITKRQYGSSYLTIFQKVAQHG